jgi:hypothetical protein
MVSLESSESRRSPEEACKARTVLRWEPFWTTAIYFGMREKGFRTIENCLAMCGEVMLDREYVSNRTNASAQQ